MPTRIEPRTLPTLTLLLAVLALSGCARSKPVAKAPLTEHQRDSVLATEPIPGAPAVGAALKASDKASQDAAAMDSSVAH
jgi:hypothetical protein